MNPTNLLTPTSVYDCSWASDGAKLLLVNVRGDNSGGYAGFSSVAGGTTGQPWTSAGHITEIASSVDAEGESVEVSADMEFYLIANGKRAATGIPARAVFTGRIAADGKQTEGVEIKDANGEALASVPPMPLVRGRLVVDH